MNKLTLCLLVLSLAAVYVDCASLKTNIFPYEQSMQRFRDIVKSYQSKFPESLFIQGLVEALSVPELDDVPFFPMIIPFGLYPAAELTQVFFNKIMEIFTYLNIDPEQIDLNGLENVSVLWSNMNDQEDFERVGVVGKPMLDLVEAIDWTVLFMFNADSANLSDAQKFFLRATLKTGFEQVKKDLSKVVTLQDLAAFDYVKYLSSFTAILATQGISIGK